MKLADRIIALSALGKWVKEMPSIELEEICQEAKYQNGWFTEESTKKALEGIARYLSKEALEKWLDTYTLPEKAAHKKVGVIMAGNIPLVGFHDSLCVLASGHKLVAKLSARDKYLTTYVLNKLIEIEPAFQEVIELQEGTIKNIEAVIATGSDNSSRYFDYYFSKYPHIIRKNRVSCAIIHGEESRESLVALGEDIFQYFGLGCRNVAKLLVPEGYSFNRLLEAVTDRGNEAIMNHKYANNYDYNRSIYLVNGTPHLDNGSLILKEETSFSSPISVLYYEYFQDSQHLEKLLEVHKDELQCIVSDRGNYPNAIPFGKAQAPELTDYADGVDTMAFLAKLHNA